MTPAQARHVVAHLVSSYPTASIAETTVRVYEKSLADFTAKEVLRAINEWATNERFFPTIADLRLLVIEERLQLPSPHEAWAEVQAFIAWKPTEFETCIGCAGLGTRLYEPGDDDRSETEVACPKCRGVGRFPLGTPPAMDGVTSRALEFVGGAWTVKTASSPWAVQADFLKAYAQMRTEEIRAANLVSLGVLEPAARHVAQIEAS